MQPTVSSDLRELWKATQGSKIEYDRALHRLPSGTTRSPYYFTPYPLYMKRGKGCYVWDVDGNKYLDFTNNMGPLILGHRHPKVMKAVEEQTQKFWCGGPTELEVRLAEKILKAFPMGDRVVFTPTGTEASMKVIRAVRAFTRKDRIMMSTGAYHGSHDGVSSDAGIPSALGQLVTRYRYNDEEYFRSAFDKVRHQLAAVLVEGVLGAAGSVPPTRAFLQTLREETEKHGVPLIFDEVVTGFRLAKGGISERLGVKPDCVILGKIIGGGFPVGAFLGPEEIMKTYEYPKADFPMIGKPQILNAGTFNAHPVTMAAGLATLSLLTDDAFRRLNRFGDDVRKTLAELAEENHISHCITGPGSIYRFHFTQSVVTDYESSVSSDERKERLFDALMLSHGVSLPAFHTAFCSTAMGRIELKRFRAAAKASLSNVSQLSEQLVSTA